MADTNYKFETPKGIVEVTANSLESAMLEVADLSGIRLINAVQRPQPAQAQTTLKLIAEGRDVR